MIISISGTTRLLETRTDRSMAILRNTGLSSVRLSFTEEDADEGVPIAPEETLVIGPFGSGSGRLAAAGSLWANGTGEITIIEK